MVNTTNETKTISKVQMSIKTRTLVEIGMLGAIATVLMRVFDTCILVTL